MPINPIDNPGAYLDIRIGGQPFPGQIVKGGIRNLKSSEEWMIVRAIAGSGWQQTHKGRIPIKGIEVEISLDASTPKDAVAAWLAHYKFLVFIRGAAPPKYKKPPALGVTGAPFKGAGVLKVVYQGHTEPVFDTGPVKVVYFFDEATKATLNPIGPPEAAILEETNPVPRTLQETAFVDAVASTRGPGAPTADYGTLSDRYPGIGKGIPE